MARDNVKVYEVLTDTINEGPAADYTQIRRFLQKEAAESFARLATCYGRPATVQECDAPRHIAKRWGLA